MTLEVEKHLRYKIDTGLAFQNGNLNLDHWTAQSGSWNLLIWIMESLNLDHGSSKMSQIMTMDHGCGPWSKSHRLDHDHGPNHDFFGL